MRTTTAKTCSEDCDYRARYYDPAIGRFISEDPFRFKGGRNFYEYVLNNPVNLRDPSGLIPWGDCFKCIYYGAVCFKKGRQCREDLDKKYPDPLDLCSATNTPYASSAYAKVCFAQVPQCQKMIESCGKCGITPPFNQVSAGSGPPKNIGPGPSPKTPVNYPPDFPGRPSDDPLNDPFAVPK